MKGLSRGKAIVVLAAILLGGATAGFLLFHSVISTVTALGSASPESEEAVPDKEVVHEPGVMYPMKERIVNLADSGGLHYLKIELALEFEVTDAKGLKGEAYKKRQDEFVKEMARRRPIMDDIITTLLGNETWTSLSKAGGKEKLRQDLKTRLGEVAGEHKLLNLYFTQFVAQ